MICQACHGSNPACAFCAGVGRHTFTKSRIHKPAPTETAMTITPNQDADLIEWAATQTWSDFAVSVAATGKRFGSLTDRQRDALISMKTKIEARNKPTASTPGAAVNPALCGFEGIEAILNKIAASGNEWPKVRLMTDSPAIPVNLILLTKGKSTGQVRMSIGDDWAGNIRDGQWTPGKAATDLDRDQKSALWTLLKDLKSDPEKVFADFGHRTGNCACCGRPLSNPESVALGMGPYCRAKVFA